jgi:hypothetical protein
MTSYRPRGQQRPAGLGTHLQRFSSAAFQFFVRAGIVATSAVKSRRAGRALSTIFCPTARRRQRDDRKIIARKTISD